MTVKCLTLRDDELVFIYRPVPDDHLIAWMVFYCIFYPFENSGLSYILLVIFVQANKEKICFGCLEVHEIAAFVLTSAGYYEAITRNCSNYYLSDESVALFAEHLPTRPNYIVGQIVHIERQIVKAAPPRPEHDRADKFTPEKGTDWLTLNSGSTPNPYGLPVGCEYFLVTVAMLPDTTIHSSSPS